MKKVASFLLAALISVGFTGCSFLEQYTPMVSVGFDVAGHQVTVGVAPIPVVRTAAEDEVVDLPAVEVTDK